MRKALWILPVLVAASIGCRDYALVSDEPVESTGFAYEVAPGQRVEVAPGDRVHVAGSAMTFTFETVIEDSRCPDDVGCRQPGRAAVRIATTVVGDGVISESLLVLSIPGAVVTPYANADVVLHRELRFRLLRLSPYPVAGGSTAPAAYRALIGVDL